MHSYYHNSEFAIKKLTLEPLRLGSKFITHFGKIFNNCKLFTYEFYCYICYEIVENIFFCSRNSASSELSEHIIHSELFTSSRELYFNLNHGTCVNLCKYILNASLFLISNFVYTDVFFC